MSIVRIDAFLRSFIRIYINRPALSMLFLGFAAGVPILLIFSSLGLWLREAGIDRKLVTMFSWAALGYSFKFIWSPLVDRLPIPVLGKLLGHRRSWLLVSQILIIIAIVMMAMTDPKGVNLNLMAIGAVLLGFSAATQDIVIDAYRIESAPSEMQTALSASYVAGYRIGMIVSGAGVLYLASHFGSTMEAYSYIAWQKSYLIMAGVMGVAVVTTLSITEPTTRPVEAGLPTSDYTRLVVVFVLAVASFIYVYRQIGTLMLDDTTSVLVDFMLGAGRFVLSGVVAIIIGYILVRVGVVRSVVAQTMWVQPITDFFERYGRQAALLLALIGLYRISDIVAGNISNLFYQDLQFTKEQIANAVKVVGVVASIGGGLIGGWVAQKTGIMRAMFIGALLACLTNLLFIVLFYTPTTPMLYMAVVTDNLAAGLASAVFVAFLSALTSIRFTAVQYALFSSLMTLAPKILGGYSGAIVEKMGYPKFFMITFIIGLPILVLVWLVHKNIPLSSPRIGDMSHNESK